MRLSFARFTTKPPPGTRRIGIEGFTPKIEPFSVSQHLSEQVECFRVFLVPHYATTPLQHHRPSEPQGEHKLTQIFRIACSTPGRISSLFTIISPPAAGIKPLLVSRSTTQNSVGTYLKIPVPIARSNATNG